jgi:signal transduction histidine kinase
MQTLNLNYHSHTQLVDFINDKNISSYPNILLQIFTGICDMEYIKRLIYSIKEIVPNIKIIGSTTSGEIIDDSVTEYSTILSFSIFENTQIKTHYTPKDKDGSYATSQKLISKFNKNKKAKVAITFTDGIDINGEDYLEGFTEYDKDLIVSGGMAGDNTKFIETFIFTEDEVLNNGAVVALLYNPNLVVNRHTSFGWVKIGKKLTITKSKDNIVYEIDGMKAVDIFTKYLGENISSQLPRMGISFPFVINRGGLDIMRAVVGKGENDSLIFAGNLREGEEVTFSYGNLEMILNEKDKLKNSNLLNYSETIFVYSCMARRILMGHNIIEELSPLSNITTVSGFFTYGEFYSNQNINQNELLNQTMTILSLSETEPVLGVKEPYEAKVYKSYKNELLEALAHLVTQTTQELAEKNEALLEEIRINKEKDKQLLQQSRLAQMGEMIAMIAHQWRQPLAAISSASLVLRMKAEKGDLNKEHIIKKTEDILDYSQHLSSTIDDFRDFFKPTKEKVRTNFISLVESALNIIGTSLDNHGITIIRDFNSTSTFSSYSNELKQVILNLIKNAEDIMLENEVDNPTIEISIYNDMDSIVLEIKDNGGGIPEDIFDLIFDPYFSTKDNQNGTGLGLYMSKTIIEEHCKGQLSVKNSDKGAVFKIVL